MLCGFLGCDLLPFNPLLGLLPPLARVPATSGPGSRRLARLVELALSESRERSAGSDVVLLRISELLFVEVIRRHVDALPPDQTGWLAGLRDPVVSRPSRCSMAIRRVPGASTRSRARPRCRGPCWPNVSRAWWGRRRSSTSRAGGCSWRREGSSKARRSPSVGLDVGYESEAAFSRAFKNVVGTSPAAWRRRRQASSTGQARPANSRVSVCTFTRSPSFTNSGTRTSMPVSSVAALVTLPLLVSPRTAGSV